MSCHQAAGHPAHPPPAPPPPHCQALLPIELPHPAAALLPAANCCPPQFLVSTSVSGGLIFLENGNPVNSAESVEKEEVQGLRLTATPSLSCRHARSGGGSHPMGCVYWKFRATGLNGWSTTSTARRRSPQLMPNSGPLVSVNAPSGTGDPCATIPPHAGTHQLANNTTVESALALTVEVFCTCAKLYYANQGATIRCRLCAGWFHPGCIGVKGKAKQDAMKNYTDSCAPRAPTPLQTTTTLAWCGLHSPPRHHAVVSTTRSWRYLTLTN